MVAMPFLLGVIFLHYFKLAYTLFGSYYSQIARIFIDLAKIDRLFFAERGELKREYNRLYSSLFKNSEIYMNVIEALASCKQGLTRKQISEKIKTASGGTLTTLFSTVITTAISTES